MSLFEDKMNLGLTLKAAELYFELPHEETRKLVEACMVKDWGVHTACLFGQNEIVIENLDGRKETIKRPKSLEVG